MALGYKFPEITVLDPNIKRSPCCNSIMIMKWLVNKQTPNICYK